MLILTRGKNAELNDPVVAEINNLFRNNKEKAFNICEIEEHLLEEHSDVFPADLTGTDAIEGAKAARQSIVADRLFDRYWNSEYTYRYVSSADDADAGLYFTRDGPRISPVAEIDQVTDPDPDSVYGVLEGRFKEIENNVDDEVSNLEDRISRLEYRIQEELGMY
ncbi:hypothetical protein [Natrinema gari]|uniref:hypothetical protein n=1 Tax=Natrinema gari TaxID=419186 RepID=UPI001267F25D|nr:hypothetical protein [Natrinema gari]